MHSWTLALEELGAGCHALAGLFHAKRPGTHCELKQWEAPTTSRSAKHTKLKETTLHISPFCFLYFLGCPFCPSPLRVPYSLQIR